MPLDRPIPAFYCCYLLRSTVSKSSSLYIGSTPNPVRRLRQHNGIAKGGAVRTSKKNLRPWEMTCIVTGFPSHIAALQFEWAWQNPHITQHISADLRLTVATQKKSSGHARRPRLSLASGLSNLHLLLCVPSFARWPLEVRFFSESVHKAWLKWIKDNPSAPPNSTTIITDFPPKVAVPVEEPKSPTSRKRKLDYGIEALSVGYEDHKPHVEKAKVAIDFEQEGSCSVCESVLEHEGGIYAICPNIECNAVTHLTCLSKHFLMNDDDDALVPKTGKCPKCEMQQQWINVVKELSLRMRGQKEVEKLLKVRRARKAKVAISASQAPLDNSESDEDEDEDEQLEEELRQLQRLNPELGDSYLDGPASEGSDDESVASMSSQQKLLPRNSQAETKKRKAMATVIEDTDWDEAEVLD